MDNIIKRAFSKKDKKLISLIIAIAVLVIAVASISIYYWYSNARLVEIKINGKTETVRVGDSYNELIKDGVIKIEYGDFIAIDGSILTKGKGEAGKLFKGKKEVTDLKASPGQGAKLKTKQGKDIVEEVTVNEDQITPFPTIVNDGYFNFYNGSLHILVSPGQEGIIRTSTGNVSGITVEDLVVQEMKPREFRTVPSTLDSGEKVIALTFDDGPHPTNTPLFLEKLKYYNVKATFFVLGTETEKYPELAQRVLNDGHQLASHCYTHSNKYYLNKIGPDETVWQIAGAQQVIAAATGYTTTIVRPPGGNVKLENLIWAADYATAYIGWDVASVDTQQSRGGAGIADNVLAAAHPGGIVLMHDGGGDRTETLAALDIIIPRLALEGYRFVTIDELIEMRKAELGITD